MGTRCVVGQGEDLESRCDVWWDVGAVDVAVLVVLGIAVSLFSFPFGWVCMFH